jgi:hypothetical protein
MKELVCGFWEGKSFNPTTFSVHNEPGKNRNRGMKNKELANQFYKERDADSPGFQRVKLLSTDKISMAIQMVKDTIKTGFKPDYVLTDSWFMCDTFVSEIQKIKIRYEKKLHVIRLIKTNRSIIIYSKKSRQV